MPEKKKIDVLADELNSPFPRYPSPESSDDMLATLRTQGLEVLDKDFQVLWSSLEAKPANGADEVQLDLTPSDPQPASDSVRIYLREMGASPLLTREGEVALAKRIERGQLATSKALSRSPVVVREVLGIGQDLKRDPRSIRDIVVLDEDEITDE